MTILRNAIMWMDREWVVVVPLKLVLSIGHYNNFFAISK